MQDMIDKISILLEQCKRIHARFLMGHITYAMCYKADATKLTKCFDFSI